MGAGSNCGMSPDRGKWEEIVAGKWDSVKGRRCTVRAAGEARLQSVSSRHSWAAAHRQ